MNNPSTINELEFIIAYADGLKIKAERLRKKLIRVHGSTSRKREPVSQEEVARVIAMRNKNLNKKAMLDHGSYSKTSNKI